MRISSIPASELFEHFREAFAWQWLAGPADRQSAVLDGSRFAAGMGVGVNMVGYLNYIHPTRVQVIGAPEAAYLDRGTPQDTGRRIRRILELRPPLVVLADGQPASEVLIRAANEHGVLLFATQASASYVVDMLYTYLTKCFAEMTSMHGVFMDILGIGVLLTGDSGLGKSELGLELISRGHGLVADDVVDLSRINQNTIMGSSPELLRNMLEVRGIGLLDVRTILGETAVRRKMRLRLIVHLVSQQIMERDCERLPVTPLTQDVLGLPVDKVIIQVGAGRNLAVLVEAAVRNFLLRLRGVDTHGEFMQRQRKAMEGQ